ncbi:MAG: Eco57I restriction-modification methylase domain-containing protein [Candidatus Zhuqueibacterota bacterium]
MEIFQKSVIEKYLQSLNETKVNTAFQIFQKFYGNKARIQNIRQLKEENYQEGFLREIFVQVLGYTINPDDNFNLTTEFQNFTDSKKADGAILKDGSAIGVIELKSTKTINLETIKHQAFNYKNNQPDCKYVITSNFRLLRFYIENATEFEEFDLFNLNKTDFNKLYLILSKDSIFNDVPSKLKQETKFHEENISDKFYKDYSTFKHRIFNNLVKNNPQYDKLLLFKKSQKLLDRLLFIFFAEDRGLVPPNAISRIIDHWHQLKDLEAYQPLYARLKLFFDHLDKGHKYNTYELPEYNGGLFAKDEILNSVIIEDDILEKDSIKLSTYDFSTEIDVNILGHIFEHSLNEIEEITSELEGKPVDKKKTKRKKEGIYYTPKYITQYIVENTIGALCKEKKQELDIAEITIDDSHRKADGKISKKGEQLFQKLNQYKEWLLTLKILDPACGSGAFLNQALVFLIEEHKINDMLINELTQQTLGLYDTDKQILENNLFGVDINEESVEIAKLSLWLRTAKIGRKLSMLNNNIKCGNSLIDDPEIAGEKAFNWEKEFPEIFAKGGFHVVIGNPPYVGEKGNADIFDSLKKIPKWLEFYRRRSNTYYFFIKHGIELLKNNGIQSLIIPREFVSADWANKVRASIINDSKIISIVDFNDLKVFKDVGTTSLILTQLKAVINNPYYFKFKSLRDNNIVATQLFDDSLAISYSTSKFDNENYKPWNFYQASVDFNETICPLSKYFYISQGLVTGADKVTNKHVENKLISKEYLGRGIFILQNNVDIKYKQDNIQLNISGNWVVLNSKEAKYIKPFIKTENLNKWIVTESEYFVIYICSNELEGQIKNYLTQFSGVLLNRSTTIPEGKVITLEEFENFSIDDIKAKYSSAGAVQKIMKRKFWWLPLYERADVPFDSTKIIVNTKNMNKFTFSSTSHYSSGGGSGGQNFIYLKSDKIPSIEQFSNKVDFTKFTNALLNSSFIQKHISNGQYNQLSTTKIGDLPIIEINVNDKNKIDIYKAMLNKININISNFLILYELQKNITSFIFGKYNIIISNWCDIDFPDLLKYFSNAGIKLKLSEESQWMDYFKEQKQKAIELKAEIDRTDKEIDQMVYELYGLTPEEIEVVENSFKEANK